MRLKINLREIDCKRSAFESMKINLHRAFLTRKDSSFRRILEIVKKYLKKLQIFLLRFTLLRIKFNFLLTFNLEIETDAYISVF